MVQLVASETTVCQGETITFNCSANGNPTVRMYHLYVNDAMVNETSSTGVWNRTMTAGGVFVYKCVASNKIGTAESMDVSVAVNGKDICLKKSDFCLHYNLLDSVVFPERVEYNRATE